MSRGGKGGGLLKIKSLKTVFRGGKVGPTEMLKKIKGLAREKKPPMSPGEESRDKPEPSCSTRPEKSGD